MLTPHVVLEYIRAEPFRPFGLKMASGRTFEVRHPEMIKVLKSSALIFRGIGEPSDVPDEFSTVSLMLAESIELLETSAR